ncbi:hypothetical protein F4818DRAFT_443798 [Hypoxylon cercidicola]|nr:hypothetical protein F4818DRAFT_443798 [Hypoxylon cercidicola]
MGSLEAIRESNDRIVSSFPAGLVAVFVGATSGIGETTLKQLVKRAREPRIYFLGRRESEEINRKGEYHYLKYDVSLLKNVDEACRYLKSKEPTINLLFLSSGSLISDTDEGLNYPTALVYCSRTRFIVNLLPQLQQASFLPRVVTVAAGGKEGKVFLDDLQATKLSVFTFRGHATSMIILSLEAIAEQAPEVSFVHVYPGFVKTGERQTYFGTSARFPPRSGDADGTSERVQTLMRSLTEDGTTEKIWKHTEEEPIPPASPPGLTTPNFSGYYGRNSEIKEPQTTLDRREEERSEGLADGRADRLLSFRVFALGWIKPTLWLKGKRIWEMLLVTHYRVQADADLGAARDYVAVNDERLAAGIIGVLLWPQRVSERGKSFFHTDNKSLAFSCVMRVTPAPAHAPDQMDGDEHGRRPCSAANDRSAPDKEDS